MEIFRINILPLEEIKKRDSFKRAVNNCPICGSPMSFQHNVDFLTNTVHELAHCDECKLQVREENHKVQ